MTTNPNQERERYLERSLPSSPESEQVILGSIILDNNAMQQAAESIGAEDFYSPINRRIFAAMLSLYAKQSPIDPILVAEEMKIDGSIESIGGASTITNLSFGIPHFMNLDSYLEVVRQKSNLRQLVRRCNSIVNNALAEEMEPASVFADAQGQINDLCLQAESGISDEHFVPLNRIIESEVFPALDRLLSGQSPKIPTGFQAIDKAIGGGIALSDVMLVAADTGAGKSAFALQAAFQIAQQGIPTAFLAGEMTNLENVMRLLSQVSGITNLNWLTHVSQTEYDNLRDWAVAIQNAPINFEHRISDLQTLGTHLRSLVRREKTKVLVIDYIQLFKLEKVDKRKRNERIAEASQETKRLANELGIAIIEVAQFNREGAKAAQASLHDLEGSGQLEKDASLICLLELGEDERKDAAGRKFLDSTVRIVKGRNAGRSEILGRFYGSSVRFDFQ